MKQVMEFTIIADIDTAKGWSDHKAGELRAEIKSLIARMTCDLDATTDIIYHPYEAKEYLTDA